MSDEDKPETVRVPGPGDVVVTRAGGEIPFAATGVEAQTVLCDGVHGGAFSDDLVRLNLFEEKHDSGQNRVVRVHNVTLVIPRSSFKPIVQALNGILASIEGKKEGLANE